MTPTLEDEVRKLRIELAAAYGRIDSLQIENQRLRRDFHRTIDDTIETCNALLQELKK